MAFVFTAFVIGVVATLAQLGLTRELIALTGGNEAAYGYALAAWLAAAGMGSAFGARTTRRPPAWAPVGAAGLAVAGYAFGLWLIWGGRALIGAAPGELIGGTRAALLALAALGPAAAAVGAAFALALRFTGEARRLYVAEAAGSCGAGLAIGLVLYRWVTPASALAVSSSAVAASAAAVVWKGSPAGRQRIAAGALAVVALAAATGATIGRGAITTSWFFERAFPGEGIVDYRTSPYGAVAITTRGERFAVYENGLLVAAYPDELAAEAAVFPAMLQRPAAERVLLLGGGLTGALDQFRKFRDVRELTYVESDAALAAAARATFAPGLARGPGVRFVATDGRGWLARAAREDDRVDVIIVSAPPPYTAQANRFYTREAFAAYKRVLATGGVVAVNLPGAANYYPPALAALLSSCRRTAALSFKNVELLPGERGALLASDGPLDVAAPYCARTLARLGIENAYLTPSYFEFEWAGDRMAAVRRASSAPTAVVNTDLKPAGLYWGLVAWGARVGGWEARLLKAVARVRLWYIICSIIAVVAIIAVAGRRFPARAAVGAAMAALGYAGLALEVLLIVAYQAVYGAAYRELAVIVGLFMAGAAAGGWWARPPSGTAARQRLVNLSGYAAVTALALPPLAYGLARYPAVPAALGHVAFGALAFAAGFCGGAFFATAAAGAPERAGRLYALDLVGGAVGGFATGAFLLPVWGITGVAVVLAVLLAGAMTTLAVKREPAA